MPYRYSTRPGRFPADTARIKELLSRNLEVPYEEEWYLSLGTNPLVVVLVVEATEEEKEGATGEEATQATVPEPEIVGVITARRLQKPAPRGGETSSGPPTLIERVVETVLEKAWSIWEAASGALDTLFSVGDPATDPDNRSKDAWLDRLKGDPSLLELYARGDLQVIDCGTTSSSNQHHNNSSSNPVAAGGTSGTGGGGGEEEEEEEEDGIDRSKLGLTTTTMMTMPPLPPNVGSEGTNDSLEAGKEGGEGRIRGGGEGYVMTLAVDSRHRKQGLATLMVQQACFVLRSHLGCSYVTLHCLRSNHRARRLYGRLGFQPKAFLRNYYHFPASSLLNDDDDGGNGGDDRDRVNRGSSSTAVVGHDALFMVKDLMPPLFINNNNNSLASSSSSSSSSSATAAATEEEGEKAIKAGDAEDAAMPAAPAPALPQ